MTRRKHNSPAFDRLIDALQSTGKVLRINGVQGMAQCPSHDDTQPSLSLRAIDGMVLTYCFAGCGADDIVAALGLTMADLYDNPRGISYSYPDGRIVDRTPSKRFKQRGNRKGKALYKSDQISDADTTVYVVEGEKDVNAIESVGGVAVSPPMGANAPPDRWDWSALSGKQVVIIADDDEPGYRHARQVSELLTGTAEWQVVKAAVGKDVSDRLAAGHSLDDLVSISLLDRLGVTSDWLNEQTFADLEYVVPGLISEGLGLLVAPPKKGKSFLVGNLAVAVAAGGKALGCIPVKARPVLVLALEDGHRRLQDRYTRINDGQPIPSGITFITKATPEECVAVIAEHLDRYRELKPLVIIDTLGKIKRAKRSGEESYQVDYAVGTQFKSLADSVPGSTVLIIHHTRKAEASDFVDLVSGTQGLAAQRILFWHWIASGTVTTQFLA